MPTTAEVQLVVDQVRERVEALLRARGLLDDEGEVADDADDDGQRMLLAASVAGREALGLRAGAVPDGCGSTVTDQPRWEAVGGLDG